MQAVAAPEKSMAQKADKNPNRGPSSADRGTHERGARAGGEASHKSNDKRSSSSSSGGAGSSGKRDRGGFSGGGGGRSGSSGGRGGSEHEGVWYDKDAGQCRDESGQFVECPEGIQGKGTGDDENRSRSSSKSGESRGSSSGHGGSGGRSGGSSGSEGGRGRT